MWSNSTATTAPSCCPPGRRPPGRARAIPGIRSSAPCCRTRRSECLRTIARGTRRSSPTAPHGAIRWSSRSGYRTMKRSPAGASRSATWPSPRGWRWSSWRWWRSCCIATTCEGARNRSAHATPTNWPRGSSKNPSTPSSLPTPSGASCGSIRRSPRSPATPRARQSDERLASSPTVAMTMQRRARSGARCGCRANGVATGSAAATTAASTGSAWRLAPFSTAAAR